MSLLDLDSGILGKESHYSLSLPQGPGNGCSGTKINLTAVPTNFCHGRSYCLKIFSLKMRNPAAIFLDNSLVIKNPQLFVYLSSINRNQIRWSSLSIFFLQSPSFHSQHSTARSEAVRPSRSNTPDEKCRADGALPFGRAPAEPQPVRVWKSLPQPPEDLDGDGKRSVEPGGIHRPPGPVIPPSPRPE